MLVGIFNYNNSNNNNNNTRPRRDTNYWWERSEDLMSWKAKYLDLIVWVFTG